MNSSSANKNLILSLLGIILVVAVVLLGAKPNWEEKLQLDDEVKKLETRYKDLLGKKEKQPEYEAGIEEYNAKYEEKLYHYPADLKQDFTIEFIDGIRENYDFDAVELGLGRPEEFYKLGATASSEETTSENSEEESEETATTEAPAEAEAEDGEAVVSADTPVAYKAQFPISYTGSYDGIKDFLNYIADYKYRMTVDTTYRKSQNTWETATAAPRDLCSVS